MMTLENDEKVLRELRKIRKSQQRIAGEIVICTIYLGCAVVMLYLIYSALRAEEE